MQPCIVKQPIHDNDGAVWGYEILYSSAGGVGEHPSDAEMASAVQSLLMQCNNDSFLEDKMSFVTFTENLMRRKVPNIFSEQSLVIQIDHDFLLLPDAMRMVREYRAEGYKVALSGFEFNSMFLTVLDTVDYVKLNFKNTIRYDGAVEVLRGLGKEIIASNVNNAAAYNAAKGLGIKYMQGKHVASVMSSEVRNVDLMASNFFRLIVAVTKDEPNLDEIEEIIARDVTLSYSLLKLVNSAYFALRSRATTVHQALVILGIAQLKQWVYLLSFSPNGESPAEFIKLSLMRASFCEALCASIPAMPISKSEAYLMGLFSTLGALLHRPMQETLDELSLPDEIKAALLTGEGRCGLLYKLVLAYEQADWHQISIYAEELDISQNVITQRYLNSMEEVNDTWKKITEAV